MYLESKEIIPFRVSVPLNSTITLTERIKAAGTIESIKVRFYPGVQLALQVYPRLIRTDKRSMDMVTYPSNGDQFVTGNDDYFVFPVNLKVDENDYISIKGINTDSVNAYSMIVDVEIDYYGGNRRIIAGAV